MHFQPGLRAGKFLAAEEEEDGAWRNALVLAALSRFRPTIISSLRVAYDRLAVVIANSRLRLALTISICFSSDGRVSISEATYVHRSMKARKVSHSPCTIYFSCSSGSTTIVCMEKRPMNCVARSSSEETCPHTFGGTNARRLQ